ncbi:regulatory protein RecX [Parasphingorhabdus cellanae]|uniref:Regulatory protein RecX n=1 Tax=Parasphingorhabdus cellanae TaxID=2806553 RepID=A0ABX7T082_9SPHN|nr:regulatory protein RecX [Parasphingorhabdus cellanae]QTD54954.1 regulatory protein RecX [Parasphingorhabdus cellanae]
MRGKALKNSGRPLDQNSLQELALRYVSRYATTRHKLKSYLFRKLRERDWSEDRPADVEAIVERFVELGYIDDALFAKNRAVALINRGYGKRRVTQALYQAGIQEGDDQQALDLSDAKKWEAARTYARKKSIGPFAQEQADQDKCRKQLQAFLRAGHGFDIASRFVFAKPGEDVEVEI